MLFRSISVLSGGEKSRVLLGRILALPTNFLLLDEPTNHLDMESIEALVDSLKDYEGAVVIVTHSELILRDLVNRLVIFEGEVPRVLEHGYDYFLEKEGWAEEDQGASKSGKVKSAKRANTKEDKAIERKISQIENEISKMEKELNGVEEQLVTASEQGHVANVTALSIRHTELQDEIKKKYSEFEILTS